MKNTEKEPISLKYIDKSVYLRISEIAASKGRRSTKKTELFEWVLLDYINMHDIDQFRNPYLLQHISDTIQSAVTGLEKRLGGRLFTIVSEDAINLSVLTQIIYSFMNKYTDPIEAKRAVDECRQIAVDHLRSHELSPMSYLDVMKDKDE